MFKQLSDEELEQKKIREAAIKAAYELAIKKAAKGPPAASGSMCATSAGAVNTTLTKVLANNPVKPVERNRTCG